MAAPKRIDADGLSSVVRCYRDALRTHQQQINRLNVFPVPDGDTGTNMALTLEAVCAELEGADGDMAAVCAAISHGSLMGARGNSGVILSQVLRGLTNVIGDDTYVDGDRFAEALGAASDAAYEAVMKPVEGTILTVVREASEAAQAGAAEGGGLAAVLDASRSAATDSLERTPDLLPVLAEAGVVDAGGAGFVLFLDALCHVVAGRDMPDPVDEEGSVWHPVAPAGALAAHAGDVSDLRYEVMYLLEAPDDAIPAFRDLWAGIGDSIVVVGGDGLWNCHIHTDDIGPAVEAGLDCGRPRDVRVTDLAEQVEEERWVREAVGEPEEPLPSERVPTAVVAVATGEGVRRIFHSLGVQEVVVGGQTMNPSTADLLAAVESAPGDQVVILPNNKNIVPVADQVDDQTDKGVRVVPTSSIPEGFASLLAYDPQSSCDENASAMLDAAGSVVTGSVTRAVRDSTCDLGPIRAGDFMGINGDDILAIDAELADVTIGLLDALVTDEHEIVTLIEGDGASDADTRRVTHWLEEQRPGVTSEVHHGGQPLYPYYVGIE